MKQIIMFLNLCFWGETYVSPFLRNLIFSLTLCLEMRHMHHPYKKTLLNKLDKLYLIEIHCGWREKIFKILMMMMTKVKMNIMMVMVMVTTEVWWKYVLV